MVDAAFMLLGVRIWKVDVIIKLRELLLLARDSIFTGFFKVWKRGLSLKLMALPRTICFSTCTGLTFLVISSVSFKLERSLLRDPLPLALSSSSTSSMVSLCC